MILPHSPSKPVRKISWHQIFLYISLLFLLVGLYRADYLKVPKIYSPMLIAASFSALFGGFVLTVAAWRKILLLSGVKVDFAQCAAGMGLSIFGKYIPGKIWMVLGRVLYLPADSRVPLSRLSHISLNDQFMTLWVGFALGGAGLLFVNGIGIWGLSMLGFWSLLSVLLLSKNAHRALHWLMRKFMKADKTFEPLKLTVIAALLPWYVSFWVLWSAAFFFFVGALSEAAGSWRVAFGFPMSAALGIIAVISPGGIGAREGAMAGYLTLCGFPLSQAATISVASRLWFLFGELFLFTLGYWADRRLKKHAAIHFFRNIAGKR